jgi:tetratricopeptide (TPR) repeat protein
MTKRAADIIEQGRTAFKRGDWAGTSKLMAEAIGLIEGDIESEADKRMLAEALRFKAYGDSRIGEHRVAVECAKRALGLSLELGDVEGEADALRRLGYIYWQKADLSMALEFYNNALEKANACGARMLVGRTMIEVGNLHNSKKDFPLAERAYREAIRILLEQKDLNEASRGLNNLGSCLMKQERFEDALTHLHKCTEVAKEAGDLTSEGWGAFNIGECLTKMGRPKESLPYLETAQKLLERTGDNVGVAIVFLVYGLAYRTMGELDLSLEHYRKSLTVVSGLAIPSLEGEILMEIGRTYIAMGDMDNARGSLELALQTLENTNLAKEIEEVKGLLEKLDG